MKAHRVWLIPPGSELLGQSGDDLLVANKDGVEPATDLSCHVIDIDWPPPTAIE